MNILLLLSGGAGFYGHRHWDEITIRLGLDDLGPGRVKAIEIVKQDYTFERSRKNEVVVNAHVKGEEITPVGELWTAERRTDDLYVVHLNYKENADVCTQDFEVTLSTGEVKALDLKARPAR